MQDEFKVKYNKKNYVMSSLQTNGWVEDDKISPNHIDIEWNTKPDSRMHTSHIIHMKYRQKKLEGTYRSKIVFLISMIVTIGAVVLVGLLQYDEYFAYINQRYDYINATQIFCDSIDIENIDIISTPIAAFLLIVFIIIYKRREFLRNKFKYRNIGLPMVVSLWNKSDRLYSGLVFGLMAFTVFGVVKNSFLNNKNQFIKVKDPSGILNILFKIVEMFLIGIRYYPVLVAFRINSFFVNFITSLYMWVDFIENIYQYGKCDSISKSVSDFGSKEEIDFVLNYFIAYKVLNAIPLSIFSSMIVITLMYRSVINLIDFILKYITPIMKGEMKRINSDSFCCLLFGIDDEDELLYSRYDVEYVINLLKTSKDIQLQLVDENAIDEVVEEIEYKPNGKTSEQTENKNEIKIKTKYLMVKPKRKKNKVLQKLDSLFRKLIYDWDPTFRFTSRFINTIIVAYVALYYFFIYFLYYIYNTYAWVGVVVGQIDPILTDILQNGVNVGDILCQFSTEMCIDQLKAFGSIPLPLPKRLNQSLANVLPNLGSSVTAIFITPVFVSFVICLIQLGFLIKDTKTHLKQLYRGKCEFVSKNVSNESVASSSFHFGGYVVGYAVWGFFIIYVTGILIGFAILFIRMFIGDNFFKDVGLKVVPAVTVFIFKKITNFIATKFVFLFRGSKILALDNFRAFNIFLYFNFFYDIFMGYISAFIRLIKAVVAGILMMPRISYGFMGRHLERMDNAYSCYSGFLLMEATHTNPIIICFCSVLYYKQLAEHIRRYKMQRRELNLNEDEADELFIKLTKFNGRLSISDPGEQQPLSTWYTSTNNTKLYNKFIVNRWHLMLRLSLNKELTVYRKHNVVPKVKKDSPSLISKLVLKCKECKRK